MERQVWLAERRAALAGVYDAEAAAYGDGPQPWDVQREWVARVLGLIPPGGVVLDAPLMTATSRIAESRRLRGLGWMRS
jgi:hypothetical protein